VLLMIPVGVGGSFTVPPLTSLLIGAVPAHRARTASGVLNMFRQMGGSLGVAAVGTVLATQHDFMIGLRISLLGIAVLWRSRPLRAWPCAASTNDDARSAPPRGAARTRCRPGALKRQTVRA
jgi:hypothetical protein